MSHIPGPWHTAGTFNPGTDHETQWVWGPTPAGAQSGEVIAKDVRPDNARLIEAAPFLPKTVQFIASIFEGEKIDGHDDCRCLVCEAIPTECDRVLESIFGKIKKAPEAPLLAEILPPETTELASPAENARLAVDRLLEDIRDSEFGLAANYARLGAVLFGIRKERFYEAWGFHSFGSYIASLADRVQKERSQLYAYIGVAEKLLPYLAEHQLVAIGISKAEQLKRFVQQSGLRPPASLVEMALDDTKTFKELRAEVFRELRQEPDPSGKWMDLGGVFLTTDEREEIELAFQLARRIDPVIAHDSPEHVQKKEIMLRLSREFIGEYIHLAEGK